MQIEAGSESRFDEVAELVRQFHEESLSEYQQSFDINALKSVMHKYIADSYLLIIDGKCQGLIAGQSVTSPFNNQKIYQEMVWFVNKAYRKYGVFLLNNAMAKLKESGYTAIVLALMYNSKTDKLVKLYERMGFKPFECHYIRSL